MDKSNLIQKYGDALKNKTESSIVNLSNQVEIDFSFQIHRINDLVREFNGNMPPNRFEQTVLAIITKGAGEKQIGLTKFRIKENTIFNIPKNVIHSSNSWERDTDGYMLTFSDTFFFENNIPLKIDVINSLSSLSQVSHSTVAPGIGDGIVGIFESIEKEESSVLQLYGKEIKALKVAELLYSFLRIFNHTEATVQNSLYNNLKNLIEANFTSHRSAKFYADSLAVHPNHLNRIIKNQTGETLKKIIANRVIIEAKYLLCTTNLSIKEISREIGFTDQNSLSRYFKKNESISMKEYRNQFT